MPLISIEEFEMELAQSSVEGEVEEDKGVKESPVSNNNSRHSTAIYQMLERVENKVISRVNTFLIINVCV